MVVELYATSERTPIQNRHNRTDRVSPRLQRYRRTRFSPNRRTRFLKIAIVFRHMFLQIAEDFSPNLQDILPISEQHTFYYVLYGEDPVSDLSLHMTRAPRSVLWVVGCGPLVRPVFPTCLRAPRSMLWIMG